jgi:hypothetical protein
MLKMIARQKDTGFGWKLEDFEFRAAFTIPDRKTDFYYIGTFKIKVDST